MKNTRGLDQRFRTRGQLNLQVKVRLFYLGNEVLKLFDHVVLILDDDIDELRDRRISFLFILLLLY